MAAVTPALLCLGALSFLRDPSSPMAAFMSFQGHYFITAFLEKSSTEKPHFRPCSETAVDPPMESHSFLESSLMMPRIFRDDAPPVPFSCKDYACSDGTTSHLVKHKAKCIHSTQDTSGSKTMSSFKTVSLKDSKTASRAKTMVMVRPGSESIHEAEPGLFFTCGCSLSGACTGAVNEPWPKSAAVVEPAPAPISLPMLS